VKMMPRAESEATPDPEAMQDACSLLIERAGHGDACVLSKNDLREETDSRLLPCISTLRPSSQCSRDEALIHLWMPSVRHTFFTVVALIPSCLLASPNRRCMSFSRSLFVRSTACVPLPSLVCPAFRRGWTRAVPTGLLKWTRLMMHRASFRAEDLCPITVGYFTSEKMMLTFFSFRVVTFSQEGQLSTNRWPRHDEAVHLLPTCFLITHRMTSSWQRNRFESGTFSYVREVSVSI